MKFLKNFFNFGSFDDADACPIVENKVSSEHRIPDGWFVFESGQSPVHFLWFVHLMRLEKTKQGIEFVWEEEYDTFEEALEKAIERVNKKQTSFHKDEEK